MDYKSTFDQAFAGNTQLGAGQFLGAIESKYGAAGRSEAQKYLQDTSTYTNPIESGVTTESPAPVVVETAPQPVQSAEQLTPTPPVAPVEKPVEAPKPTTETPKTETAPKVEAAPVIDNNNPVRANEIVNHLKDGYTNDSTIKQAVDSGDFEAFKTFYDMKDPQEAKIVEAFFQARQPKDEQGVYNILRTGQNIYNPNITSQPYYKTASDRLADYKRMSNYGASQFSVALKDNSLIPGTAVYNDLLNNPVTAKALKDAEKLNTINKVTTNTDSLTAKASEDIFSKNPTLKNAFADGTMSKQEYDKLFGNPQIDQAQAQALDLKNNYDRLKATYDGIEDDVMSELKGSGASDSYAQSLIAQRRKGIFKSLQIAQDTYNNQLGYLTDLKKTQADIANINLSEYQKTEQRTYEEGIRREERTYEEKQYEKKLKDQFDYEYGDLTSTNPQVQRVAAERMASQIQEQYKGMPFRRDVPTMASDILSELASGKTTEQITTDITNAIQNAPAYKTWSEKAGLAENAQDAEIKGLQIRQLRQSLTEGKAGWKQVGDYYENDGKLYTEDQIDAIASGDTSASTGVLDPISIASYSISQRGRENLQCGELVNDYWKQNTGSKAGIGDTLQTKINTVNNIGASEAPIAGGIFVSNPLGNNVGHTGIVTSVNSDGSFTVLEANAKGKASGQPPVEKTYSSTKGMIFSVPPATKPSTTSKYTGVAQELLDGTRKPSELRSLGYKDSEIKKIEAERTRLKNEGYNAPGELPNTKLGKLGQFMIDNQDRGVGYSNDDVDAFNAKINRLAKNGDEAGMAIAYRNMLMKDNSFKKQFDDTSKFISGLKTVENMVNEYEKAGKTTNAAKGMAEKIARTLGLTTDEALVRMQTQMGFTLANYIKTISGTAASDAEVQRLMGNMAQIGNVKQVNSNILKQAKTVSTNDIKAMIDNRMYGLPEELKPKVFGDIYTKEAPKKSGLKESANGTYTYKSPLGFSFSGVKGDGIDDKVVDKEAQTIINNAIKKNPKLKGNKQELLKIILQDPDFRAINFKFN